MPLHAVDDARLTLKSAAKTVGAHIRQLRLASEWTQEELATQAKVALGTVQTAESGKRQPRYASLERIAHALETTPEALLQPDRRDDGDPRLAGLLQEDLLVARAYHDCSTLLRQRIQALLRQRELATEQLTDYAPRVASDEDIAEIAGLLTGLDPATRARLIDLFRSTVSIMQAPDREVVRLKKL